MASPVLGVTSFFKWLESTVLQHKGDEESDVDLDLATVCIAMLAYERGTWNVEVGDLTEHTSRSMARTKGRVPPVHTISENFNKRHQGASLAEVPGLNTSAAKTLKTAGVKSVEDLQDRFLRLACRDWRSLACKHGICSLMLALVATALCVLLAKPADVHLLHPIPSHSTMESIQLFAGIFCGFLMLRSIVFATPPCRGDRRSILYRKGFGGPWIFLTSWIVGAISTYHLISWAGRRLSRSPDLYSAQWGAHLVSIAALTRRVAAALAVFLCVSWYGMVWRNPNYRQQLAKQHEANNKLVYMSTWAKHASPLLFAVAEYAALCWYSSPMILNFRYTDFYLATTFLLLYLVWMELNALVNGGHYPYRFLQTAGSPRKRCLYMSVLLLVLLVLVGALAGFEIWWAPSEDLAKPAVVEEFEL